MNFTEWRKESDVQDMLARLHKAEAYQSSKNGCDGNTGKMMELLLASSTANHCKDDISPAGVTDFYIADTSGVVRPVECKINGGAIDCLLNTDFQDRRSAFFVYYYNLCNKNTRYEAWQVAPLIFTYQDFLELLEEVNAIKPADGRSNPTTKIQAGTRKFFNALQVAEYGIPYMHTHHYTIINGHAVDEGV